MTKKISIHALREEGDASQKVGTSAFLISIHALREEGDGPAPNFHRMTVEISIHALREEGDSCRP